MIISHQKKFIFIHIYKAAGTSVTSHFVPYARLKDKLAYQYLISRKIINGTNILLGISNKGSKWFTGYHKHITAVDLKADLNNEIFNNYFKFAFVRDPYEWLGSYYFYIREYKPHDLNKIFNKLNFNDFIVWHLDQKPLRQVDFIKDEADNIIVDYIGKVETLNTDLKYICYKLGIPYQNKKIKNRTKGKKHDYRSFYNEKTKKMVRDYFKEDFDFFGYEQSEQSDL